MAQTVGRRLRGVQPYESLIFFVLAVLLALCIVVAQVVVVHAPAATKPEPGAAGDSDGLDSAFEWRV